MAHNTQIPGDNVGGLVHQLSPGTWSEEDGRLGYNLVYFYLISCNLSRYALAFETVSNSIQSRCLAQNSTNLLVLPCKFNMLYLKIK